MRSSPFLAVIVAGAIVGLWYVRLPVMLVLAAILFAIALDAGIRGVQQIAAVPRLGALALLILAIAGVAAAFGAWRGEATAAQFVTLRTSLPEAVRHAGGSLADTGWGRSIGENLPSAADLITAIPAALQRAGGLVSTTLGFFVAAAFIAFVAVCLAIEPQTYVSGFVRLFPIDRRDRVSEVLAEIGAVLRRWLIARLISMFVLGTLVTIGLSVLRIPLADSLGLLAGLLAFVPNVGAVVAAVPAILLALARSPQTALFVIAMYWIVHSIDDFVVIPIAERRVVRLPPALTISMQAILALTAGPLGVLLAAPLTAAAIVIVRLLWIDDVVEAAA